MDEMMNVEKTDQMRESVALLRLLEDSAADVEAGTLRDSGEVFADIRRVIAEKRGTQE